MQTIPELRKSIKVFSQGMFSLAQCDDASEISAALSDLHQLSRDIEIAKRNLTDRIKSAAQQSREENSVALRKSLNRILHEIPKEIGELEYQLRKAEAEFEGKVMTLKGKGFADAEIARIVQPITDDDRKAVANKIAALREEDIALSSFRRSGPGYNFLLLKGTTLEYLIPADLPEAA